MAMYNPQAEAELVQAVAQTIGPIAHTEKQHNAEQMQKMILDYAGRAAKRKTSSKPWQEVASDFTYSFFESIWKVFGDSPWLEKVDFTWMVGAAFKLHFARPEIASISDQEFYQVFSKETALGLDCSRYYSWSAVVLKKVVNGKATQKKVRDVVDNSREALLKQTFETAEEFVKTWIQDSVKALGQDAPNVLPKSTALKLFESYAKEGGGIPLWLMQEATDSVLSEIKTTISTVYSGFPDEGANAWGKGGSNMGAGGSGAWGKGGSNAWGAFGADSFGDQWGAGDNWGAFGGGKGMWGFSPY